MYTRVLYLDEERRNQFCLYLYGFLKIYFFFINTCNYFFNHLTRKVCVHLHCSGLASFISKCVDVTHLHAICFYLFVCMFVEMMLISSLDNNIVVQSLCCYCCCCSCSCGLCTACVCVCFYLPSVLNRQYFASRLARIVCIC